MERFSQKRTPIFIVLILLACAATAPAKDVRLYKITKGIHYQQSVDGAPAVLAENGYVFQANVVMGAPGSVLSATVVSQEGTVRTLEADGNDKLEFRNRVNTKNTLETRYPDGNFTYTINTRSDGQRVISLPLTGSAYPPAPVVQNLPALQSVNAHGYIIVSWDRFPSGGESDFIQLRIEEPDGDLAWESRDFGEPGALDGTATQTLIKPGELDPNTTYTARLSFEKTSTRDTTAYIGSLGWSTYHARTEFTLKTSGDAAPNVQRYEVAKGRHFEQDNLAGPFPEPGEEFLFSAEVRASAPNLVSSASVTSPSSVTVQLTPNSDRDKFDFTEASSSQPPIDARYPAGNYVFQIQTASQGARTLGLWLDARDYPPAPRVHFDPSQRINPDSELVIAWDAWPGGTAEDFIQLRIEEEDGGTVFETADFDDKDALDGRATTAVIPAGTLVRGKDYEARLTFRRFTRVDPSSYPGALGIASYFARTKFDIETLQPDVRDYAVFKGRVFVQTNPGPSVVTGYVFSATIDAETPQSVATAAIITPTGRTVFLTQQSSGDQFELEEFRNSQGALDADFPDGNYILAVNTVNDGGKNIPVALVNSTYPNAPRLADYNAAGHINAPTQFPLAWDAFAGGTDQDYIDAQIEEMDGDEVFDTPGFGNDEALDGRETSVTLPRFALQTGRSYMGRLLFEKILRANDDGYPGVKGRVGYFAKTYVPIATLGPGNPPLFQGYSVLGDGRIQFSLTTLDGGTYYIQGSPNMIDWTNLGSVSAAANLASFTAPPPPTTGSYFYRAVLVR